MSKLGLVKDIIKGGKEAAPFFSAADKAAMELKRGKGTGKEFITELKKAPGVKAVELEHRKLGQIEQMPKMTKEEFLAELQKRPPQQVEEKVISEPTKREIEDRAHEMAYDDAFQELRDEGMNRHEAEDIAADLAEERVDDYLDRAAEDLSESGDVPFHGDYTMKGGENYREILLKVPSFKGEKKLMELEAMRRRVDPELHSHRYNQLTKEIEALQAEKAAMPEQFQGVGAHFGGEPGVLASIRVKDRVMPSYTKQQAQEIGQRIADGLGVADQKNLGNGSIAPAIKNGLITPKEAAQYADFRGFQGVDTTGAKQKVLHIEEIQSDWHQQGRKKGYKTPEIEARRKELEELAAPYMDGSRAMPPELRKEIEALPPMNAVPDAPFKKNWHELAMKRMLNYAAENGYDKIAITPGAEQASRYNLANHVNQVEVYKLDDGLYNLEVIDKNGKPVSIPDSRAVTPDRISEIVGKDVAEKAIKQADDAGQSILGGLDLEVGGEGMKGFYDKMLPDYLNQFGKKHGTQVQMHSLPVQKTPDLNFPEEASQRANLPSHVPGEVVNAHSFDITPEMREELKGGTPLYQKIAAPVGAGAAGEEALDEEPKYAAGGAVGNPVGEEYDPDQSDGGLVVRDSASFKRGGRVKISDNPDAMFLELQDKKLKRK